MRSNSGSRVAKHHGKNWQELARPASPGGSLRCRSVDNMNTSVSGRKSLNGAAEPDGDLLEIDVFDGRKSVRAKNRCNASRIETADRTFINFLKLFGPLRF